MIVTMVLSGALTVVAALIGRHIYRNTGRSSYIRHLRDERIRRSKRKTKSNCVWLPAPSRW